MGFQSRQWLCFCSYVCIFLNKFCNFCRMNAEATAALAFDKNWRLFWAGFLLDARVSERTGDSEPCPHSDNSFLGAADRDSLPQCRVTLDRREVCRANKEIEGRKEKKTKQKTASQPHRGNANRWAYVGSVWRLEAPITHAHVDTCSVTTVEAL